MEGKEKKGPVSSASENELPPEFKEFDKPLGIEQHHMNIFILIVVHSHLFYYLFYLLPFGLVPKATLLLGIVYGYFTGLGITAGAHRYWCHRSFKAKLPLRIFLMLAQTGSFEYPIFKWCREHRVHHKYSDTDADPHNANRGFWFSHILWLTEPPHPQVLEKYKTVDVSDLINDPIVRFQSKYYYWLLFLMQWVVPITLCHLLFPEISFSHLIVWNHARYCYILHVTFTVNSFAHLWGNKPYDKYIRPAENRLVALVAIGEGWHNFHHTFPWDYKTAELGFHLNFTTWVINFFAWIGWAYDLKTVNHKLLADRVHRTGDGSHALHNSTGENGMTENILETSAEPCWGWGDDKLKTEDIEVTETLFPLKLD